MNKFKRHGILVGCLLLALIYFLFLRFRSADGLTGNDVAMTNLESNDQDDTLEIQPGLKTSKSETFFDEAKFEPPTISIKDLPSVYHGLLAQPGENSPSTRTRINNLMSVMVVNSDKYPELMSALVAIHHDPSQDVVIRDYAIQHLVQMWSVATESSKDVIAAVLFKALDERTSTIAGTALLGLFRISSVDKAVGKARVGEHALDMAADDQAGVMVRATALQVCAEMKISEVAPIAVKLLDKNDSPIVRKSAIKALTKLGEDDEAFAQKWNIAGLMENCHECF